jgi:glycosyltransferase involved in cell wall biosynthesis
MAMSLPVITTDVRGCREAVRHGETGLVVPPRDAVGLAQAIARLARDEAMRTSFGAGGRARVLAEYDERLVFDRLEEVYAQIGWRAPAERSGRLRASVADSALPLAAP